MVYVMLFSFVIYSVTYASKSHFARTMCQSRDPQDCSFQIHGAEENACQIYNTSDCVSFNFSRWSNAEYKYPERELSPSFGMTLHPYRGEYMQHQSYLLPAINISMWSINKEINGFVLTISGGPLQKNICRIFDFRRVSYEHRKNVSLFYDCIFLEHASSKRSYFFVLQALPVNEVLKYEVLVPDGEESNADALCLWKTLIMIFIQSLEENIIEVKFVTAPKEYNVTVYNVILYSVVPEQKNSQRKISVNVIETKEHGKMLFTAFDHVDVGYYYVKIQPIKTNEVCNGTTSSIIFIRKTLFDKNILGYISAVIIVTVAIVIAIQLYIRWKVKPETCLSSPRILVVHSYDFKEHDTAVAAYIKVLERKGCKVKSIYGSGHPSEWFWKHYEEADVIVIVISFGVYHKIEKCNNPPLPERHKWQDRLTPAISFICDEITASTKCKFAKKIAKVCFEYSGSQHIPQKMKFSKWGKTFALPKQMHKFMQYIHTREHQLCYSIVCPFVRKEEENLTPEMKNFQDRIKAAKEVFDNEIVGDVQNACKRETFPACTFPDTNSSQSKINCLKPLVYDSDNHLDAYDSLSEIDVSESSTSVTDHFKDETDYVNDRSIIMKDNNSVEKQVPCEKDMWSALFTEGVL